jgi:3'(2'), 5'-bisphosphate nucleotidase
MTLNLDDALTRRIIAASHEAGEKILEIYGSEFTVQAKDDRSPVTEADEASEAIIVRHLEAIDSSIPYIAEEAYGRGHRPDVGGGTFWLVDALDGTKEFIRRNGEFTVNIALIRDRRPIFGVVHIPALDTTYWGGPDGAFRQVDGQQTEAIAARSAPAEGLTVMTSRSHRSEEDDFLAKYNVANEIHAGSSLKFCLVAAGEADFYPRLGPTMEWDTGAGNAVLLAAGGRVETLEGAPFTYGKPEFRNPHFLAFGRRD